MVLLGSIVTGVGSAQDMLAVSWSGTTYALDSYTGALTPLSSTLCCANAADVAAGTVWSTHRSSGFPTVHNITSVDTVTGVATIVYADTPDIRSMASDGETLWCIDNSGTTLTRMDPSTGVFTPVGPINPSGAGGGQGLAWHQGTLYVVGVPGLMTVDPVTGIATDVNPAVGTPTLGSWQFLVSRSDGTLLAGGDFLWEVDSTTGVGTLIASLNQADLRGAVEVYGNARPFGAGCAGTFGTVSLTVGGSLVAGGTLETSSSSHEAGALGALVLGAERLPVPASLDPVFGTVGCLLYTAQNVVLAGVTLGPEPANLFFTVPLDLQSGGNVLHLQHLVLESVAGGLSASNGVTLHVGF